MRTSAALFLCLALVPPAVRAQTAGTIDLTETNVASRGGVNDQIINLAECAGNGDTLTLTWNVNGTWADTWSVYRLFSTTASDCSAATSNSLGSEVAVTANSTIGTLAGVAVQAKLVTPYSVTCTPNGTEPTNVRLCASVYDSGGGALAVTASKVVVFDFALPDPPTGVSTTPGDGALNVGWTAATTGATSSSFDATATPVAPTAGQTCSAGGNPGGCSATTGATSCRITGLTNLACYQVTVVASSVTGNPSVASAPGFGVPVPVDDFWKHYGNDGGREQGGCGGPVGALALLSLLPLYARLRRRAP